MKNKGLLYLGILLCGIGFWIALIWLSIPVQMWVYGFLCEFLDTLGEHTMMCAGMLIAFVVGYAVRGFLVEE